MKPKALIVTLFTITFVVSFIVYLVVVSFIAPVLDLSSSAKKDLELAPELNSNEEASGDYVHGTPNVPGEDGFAKSNNLTNQSNTENDQPVVNNAVNDVVDDVVESHEEEAVSTPVVSQPKPTEPLRTFIEDKPKTNGNSSGANAPKPVPTPPVKLPPIVKPIMDNSLDTKPQNTSLNNSAKNRVMIGSFSSAEEADKLRQDISNNNTGLTPIVKQVNGKYSVQVGAFADKQRAENLVNKLNSGNYSAKIKNE